MDSKKIFNINFIAPIILFAFITFINVGDYIFTNPKVYRIIDNILSSVICSGLGLSIGFALKVLLLPQVKGLKNSLIIHICTYVTYFLATMCIMLLFKIVFGSYRLMQFSKPVCFLLVGLFAADILKKLILKKNKIKAYIFAGVLSAAATTLIALLSNSWWHYLSFNFLFDFVDPTPYSFFVSYDFTYRIGIIGTLRYPVLFALVLLIFLTNIFLHKKGIDFLDAYDKKIDEDLEEMNAPDDDE